MTNLYFKENMLDPSLILIVMAQEIKGKRDNNDQPLDTSR
jgi:hypothetical protein